MAGPYAHLTLLHELMNSYHAEESHRRLLEVEMVAAVRDFFPFCALGALSPDIPNLSRDGVGEAWSDAMHYSRSGEMVVCGVRHVSRVSAAIRPKLLAWLLGYCAHVVTDMTIHPVVRAMVGDYTENRRRHRICEMNQDAYIFARMNLGELRDSDRFTRHILACHQPGKPGLLDFDVVALWDSLFSVVHPRLYAHKQPSIQEWFSEFCLLAGNRTGRNARMLPLAALISAGIQRDYPLRHYVDQGFIQALAAPDGSTKPYDDIFNKAVGLVRQSWDMVGRGVLAGDGDYLANFGDWDLDTGMDEGNRLVFWS